MAFELLFWVPERLLAQGLVAYGFSFGVDPLHFVSVKVLGLVIALVRAANGLVTGGA
jgi:hypothetical protein